MIEVYPGCFREEISPGLELVVEPIPHAHTVALGVWLPTGSRHDPKGKEGLAHFTEHMVFKGTEHYSATDIAQIVDSLGGNINGATSEEYTVFHTTVLPEGIGTALDILAELVSSPRFSPEDIERERAVALEEIREAEDSPEEVVLWLLERALWGEDHPLGHPVLGHKETVASLSRRDLQGFFADFYLAGRKTVVACGKVDPNEVKDVVEEEFTHRAGKRPLGGAKPKGLGRVEVQEKPIQQVHVAIGFPGLPAGAPERIGLEVLNTVLGGSMSSRLFRKVREERGLAYTVASFVRFYTDSGYIGIYAATEPKRCAELLGVISRELVGLCREGPSLDELRRAKRRIRGLLLLGFETPSGRMGRLGWLSAMGLPLRSPEEVLKELEAVDVNTVRELAARHLRPEAASLGMVGPREGELLRLARAFTEVRTVA